MNQRSRRLEILATSSSLSSPEGGEGRGEEGLFIGSPLSLALSPLLRRGEREFTARCRIIPQSPEYIRTAGSAEPASRIRQAACLGSPTSDDVKNRVLF